jgi:hypothetical protein
MVDSGSTYKCIAEGYIDISEDPKDLGNTDSKEEYISEPEEALTSGTANDTAVYQDDDYGDLISGFAPIFDSHNQIVGLVGLDLGADIIHENTYNFLRVLILIMVLSCAISCKRKFHFAFFSKIDIF